MKSLRETHLLTLQTLALKLGIEIVSYSVWFSKLVCHDFSQGSVTYNFEKIVKSKGPHGKYNCFFD